MWLTNYKEIKPLLHKIDAEKYQKSRNYLQGSVTKLSPYITHGMLPLKEVADFVNEQFKYLNKEKLLSELSWKEYFYNNWEALGDNIFKNINKDQEFVRFTHGIPSNLDKADLQINVLNQQIKELKQTGYMHNHARMWLAFYLCHIGKYYWFDPSKWMYYWLFDGDLSVNMQSWQWVAGTSRNKIYVANQENINKYSNSKQFGTIIDVNYEAFDDIENFEIPSDLTNQIELHLPEMNLPNSDELNLKENEDTYIYHLWNLDVNWCKDNYANKVLLIEPSHLQKFPFRQDKLNWLLEFAKENISNIQVFVGESDELFSEYKISNSIMQYHPALYKAKDLVHTLQERPRIWPNAKGYHKSFFAFYKQATKSKKHFKLNK